MKEIKIEKKSKAAQSRVRAKSVQDKQAEYKFPKHYRGNSLQPPEQFAPLIAELSHPANVVPRAQVLTTLQQTYGNRYVRRIIQAKLRIGQPHDIYEREADMVAERVVNMSNPQAHEPLKSAKSIRTKPVSNKSPQIEDALESRINQASYNGQPLPHEVRLFMETRFGMDFSTVRVHTDSKAAQISRDLNAQAFTKANDIYFGAGRYNLGTTAGKRLLAHELTHVVQQGEAGRRVDSGIRTLQLEASSQVQTIQLLSDAYDNYSDSCECGERLGNNCAHYLSNALIKAGYTELDGGTGALFRRVHGRIVCKAGRPVRAKELRDWFAGKASQTLNNADEGTVSSGYWAVYQERARDGQGHVLIHSHSGSSYSWRGTGNYPDWDLVVHYKW